MGTPATRFEDLARLRGRFHCRQHCGRLRAVLSERQVALFADRFVVTSHSVMGRAAEREFLGREIEKHGRPWESVEKVVDAVGHAIELAGKRDMVLVTGSVFAVGEARRRWKGASA